jgi:hypothetical protein
LCPCFYFVYIFGSPDPSRINNLSQLKQLGGIDCFLDNFESCRLLDMAQRFPGVRVRASRNRVQPRYVKVVYAAMTLVRVRSTNSNSYVAGLQLVETVIAPG